MKNDLLNNLRSHLDGLKYRSKKAQEKLKKTTTSYEISSWSRYGRKWESAITPMGFGRVVARTFSPVTGVYSYQQVVYNLSNLTMTLSSFSSHRDYDSRKLKDLRRQITDIEADGGLDDQYTAEIYLKLKAEADEMESLPHVFEDSTEAFFSLVEMMGHLGLNVELPENYDYMITEKALNIVGAQMNSTV